MSYDLCAIAIDLDKVQAAIGSKDTQLLATLTEEFAGELQQIDDLLPETLDEDEDPMTATEALQHLIMGEPYREDAGLAYCFCYEILCLHFGESLDNDAWTSIRAKWFDVVQEGLTQAGVREKALPLASLAFGGTPTKMPDSADYPNIGHFTKAEVAKAHAALTKADLAKIENTDVLAAIRQLGSWLDECVRSNRDLVCTYA